MFHYCYINLSYFQYWFLIATIHQSDCQLREKNETECHNLLLESIVADVMPVCVTEREGALSVCVCVCTGKSIKKEFKAGG